MRTIHKKKTKHFFFCVSLSLRRKKNFIFFIIYFFFFLYKYIYYKKKHTQRIFLADCEKKKKMEQSKIEQADDVEMKTSSKKRKREKKTSKKTPKKTPSDRVDCETLIETVNLQKLAFILNDPETLRLIHKDDPKAYDGQITMLRSYLAKAKITTNSTVFTRYFQFMARVGDLQSTDADCRA